MGRLGAVQTRRRPGLYARELLREEQTAGQLATEPGIHPTQMHTWRSTAAEGLPRAVQPQR